jgi:hypothetical protein
LTIPRHSKNYGRIPAVHSLKPHSITKQDLVVAELSDRVTLDLRATLCPAGLARLKELGWIEIGIEPLGVTTQDSNVPYAPSRMYIRFLRSVYLVGDDIVWPIPEEKYPKGIFLKGSYLWIPNYQWRVPHE